MSFETAFSVESSSIKFGPGVTHEVGQDMQEFGAHRVMVVTDPNLADSEPVAVTLKSLRKEGIDTILFDQVHIEPTDLSFKEAIQFAEKSKFDGYVAVGGGSSMDTAKAANLYSTYPADLLTYVNAPIGQSRPVPGPLKPLIAIPTTAGTGSETSGVAIFDFLEMRAKVGISHRMLRPLIGIVDPLNTRTLPKMVAACTGLDTLISALEALTVLPFNKRPAPEKPSLRPVYQGANPISHVWASQVIEMVSQNLIPALEDPTDGEARAQMSLAASLSGIGFGNAGCHVAHAMSYAVSGMVRDYLPTGYPPHEPIIPHGMAVILNAPAAFRFTAPASPDLHLHAARLMDADTSTTGPEDAGELLAGAIINLMRRAGIPNGLSEVGFTSDDVGQLVAKALPQHRLLKLSPRPVSAEDLDHLFLESLVCW